MCSFIQLCKSCLPCTTKNDSEPSEEITIASVTDRFSEETLASDGLVNTKGRLNDLLIDSKELLQTLDLTPNSKTIQLKAANQQMIEIVEEALIPTLNSSRKDLIHDLKTPLQTIRLTLGHDLNSQSVDDIKITYQHLERLIASLEEDIYTQSELCIHPSEFSLRELREYLSHLLTPLATEQGIKLNFDTPDQFEKKWIGDFMKISRVTVNLAGNALKYCTRGNQILISIACDQNTLKISVQDNGPGISPEVQRQLFRRFSKGNLSSPQESSSGLGLYLCKQFVTLMNPTSLSPPLEFHSEEGRGSTFWFTVPLQPVVTKKLSGFSILLAEDNRICQKLYQKMLKKDGFVDVSSAENGQEALDRSRKRVFDVAILDNQMPILKGAQVAIEIFKNRPRCPHIFILSGEEPAHIRDSMVKQDPALESYIIHEVSTADDLSRKITECAQYPLIIIGKKPILQSRLSNCLHALLEPSQQSTEQKSMESQASPHAQDLQ